MPNFLHTKNYMSQHGNFKNLTYFSLDLSDSINFLGFTGTGAGCSRKLQCPQAALWRGGPALLRRKSDRER